eukprot:gene6108-9169_t
MSGNYSQPKRTVTSHASRNSAYTAPLSQESNLSSAFGTCVQSQTYPVTCSSSLLNVPASVSPVTSSVIYQQGIQNYTSTSYVAHTSTYNTSTQSEDTISTKSLYHQTTTNAGSQNSRTQSTSSVGYPPLYDSHSSQLLPVAESNVLASSATRTLHPKVMGYSTSPTMKIKHPSTVRHSPSNQTETTSISFNTGVPYRYSPEGPHNHPATESYGSFASPSWRDNPSSVSRAPSGGIVSNNIVYAYRAPLF